MQTLTSRQQQILDFIREQIRSTGYPPTRSEICQFFGFKSPNAAEEHLRALARKGAIEMIPGSSRALRLIEDTPANDGTLPLIGKVAAGTPILAVENIDRQVPLQADLFSPQPDYLLTVQGTSMQDIGILDGDIIAVHKADSANNNQIVVARVDDEVTVKRLQIDRLRQKIRLLPENPDFQPIEVSTDRSEFAIEGLVVGVIRTSI